MKRYKILLLALAVGGSSQTFAQLPKSAMEYMLQRPKVSKFYKNKTFGDHLFMEGGLGATTVFTKSASAYMNKPAVQGTVAVGDWITPEHGLRLGVNGGQYKLGNTETKFAGVSLDYLLNITALSQREYYSPKPFEVYGVFGGEYQYSHIDGENKDVFGAHVGLRGQVRLSDYTYLYVEPRLGMYTDELIHSKNWRGYRPAGQLMAGVGYRLLQESKGRNRASYLTSGSFLDDTYMQFLGGARAIINSNPATWQDYMGARAAFRMGKWFDPYSALQLELNAGFNDQNDGKPRNKAVGAGLSYVWNMHNTFGGYNPNRIFYVNALAGGSVNVSAGGEGRNTTFGIGGGLQGNFRLAKGVDFFIEPRFDAYQQKYASKASTAGKWDVVASLMGGFTFKQGLNTKAERLHNEDFKSLTPYDNMFIEGGIGGTMPVTRSSAAHPFDYVRPKAFAAIGKWFNAISGTRIWAEGEQLTDSRKKRVKVMALGADYLWNMTNTFHGYDPERRAELIGGLGINIATRNQSHKVDLGANASVKGLLHLNKMWGLYLEPQVRVYGDKFLPNSTNPLDLDISAALLAGIQISFGGYSPADNMPIYEESGKHSFFSVAGGIWSPVSGIRNTDNYGLQGRISYGRWYTPVSAWRINAGGFYRNPNHHYVRATLGADYMADLSTLSYGYNPDRVVITRALLGANFGADYAKGKAYFSPDIHVGGQLAFRVSPSIELYAEPQVSYVFGERYGSRTLRMHPSAYIGLNYNFGGAKDDEKNISAPDKNSFVSFAIGTGVNTQNVVAISPFGRKLTLDFDVSYGKWITGLHGFRAGLYNSTLQVRGKHNSNITSFHADYMLNLLSATTSESTEDQVFQLSGFAGVNASVGGRKEHRPTWGVGLEAGLQLGAKVSDGFEIFLEPCAQLMSKTIMRNSGHPAEGNVKLMLGTKYNF